MFETSCSLEANEDQICILCWMKTLIILLAWICDTYIYIQYIYIQYSVADLCTVTLQVFKSLRVCVRVCMADLQRYIAVIFLSIDSTPSQHLTGLVITSPLFGGVGNLNIGTTDREGDSPPVFQNCHFHAFFEWHKALQGQMLVLFVFLFINFAVPDLATYSDLVIWFYTKDWYRYYFGLLVTLFALHG